MKWVTEGFEDFSRGIMGNGGAGRTRLHAENLSVTPTQIKMRGVD